MEIMSKKDLVNIIDVFDPEMSFEVDESSEKDNEHILAKVKGVFFCPNGKSRNQRYYSESLWKKALGNSDVQEKLKTRTMFGTVGHETELNDKAILEGRISHIVTDAYIDKDGRGIGEALILNTPAGKVLNTILRAGSQVFVSSRAEGRFKGEHNGMPKVDEDAYKLHTWDFVLNPGFKQASPQLAEALENINKSNDQGDTAMDETLKKVMTENIDLKNQLESQDKEVKKLKESIDPITEENVHVKDQLVTAEEKIKELEESNDEFKTLLNEAKAELEIIEEIGEDATDVKDALEKAANYIEEIHSEIGTKEEIVETLTQAIAFKEDVDAIGTCEEIHQALKIGEDMLDEKLERERVARVDSICEEFSVKAEIVEKLHDKGLDDEEVKSFLADLVETTKIVEDTVNDEEEEILDVVESAPTATRSRLNRLMGTLG